MHNQKWIKYNKNHFRILFFFFFRFNLFIYGSIWQKVYLNGLVNFRGVILKITMKKKKKNVIMSKMYDIYGYFEHATLCGQVQIELYESNK